MDPTIAGASEIFFIIPFLKQSAIATRDDEDEYAPDHLVDTWNTCYQGLTVSIVTSMYQCRTKDTHWLEGRKVPLTSSHTVVQKRLDSAITNLYTQDIEREF